MCGMYYLFLCVCVCVVFLHTSFSSILLYTVSKIILRLGHVNQSSVETSLITVFLDI